MQMSNVSSGHSQTLSIVMGKISDFLLIFQDSFSAVIVENGVEGMYAETLAVLF